MTDHEMCLSMVKRRLRRRNQCLLHRCNVSPAQRILMPGIWLFIFNNVNISVELYLYVFGTFHCGFFGKSITFWRRLCKQTFMDSTVMQQHVSNCVNSNA